MKFFNANVDIEKTRHKLPHWQQGEVAVFVTFRLADSLPRAVLEPWLIGRNSFLDTHPPPWDEATEESFHTLFSARLDEYLDVGHGCCALRNPHVARIVADRFHHFNDQRYRLWNYVIMPNHAHVLFSLNEDHSLPDTLLGWKGVSSRLIHKGGLASLNPFWQPEYFDRLIRSPEHFEKITTYIRDNPDNAKLPTGSYLHWARSA